ncbi:septal ring lytic transglycosylase RlpA family protein [Pseudomonas protegens]|uniref:septal ring lytic transglycosylase RlpA family protein n=1 Tax=Pseudomonas protegens TaxID=380021 RepID=UPI001B330990|nr:septal ring lytic transglycosylase RlpA family protein [Pseudomonas protegens]MBP5121541.1 septal ring lytic transglycosylase RlpA family protein [Pseudomonas protegens]
MPRDPQRDDQRGQAEGHQDVENAAADHAAHGNVTASGEPFDQNGLTAAHRELPFGTRVQVTNLGNDKSVVVRINDRGPHTRGRLIDLSRAAAQQLDMLRRGSSAKAVMAWAPGVSR